MLHARISHPHEILCDFYVAYFVLLDKVINGFIEYIEFF